MPLFAKNTSAWKPTAPPYVKHAGAWKIPEQMWGKVAGVWRPVFGGPGLSLFTSVQADGPSVTVPATVNNGDLGLFVDYPTTGSAMDGSFAGTPPGWTLAYNNFYNSGTGTAQRQHNRVHYKILTTADRNTVLTGTSYGTATGSRRKLCAVFRSDRNAISELAMSAWTQSYASAVNPTAVTVASGTQPYGWDHSTLAVMNWRNGSTVTPVLTPAATGTIALGTSAAFHYRIMSKLAPPVDVVGSQTSAGSAANSIWGAYFRIR